MTIRHLEKTNLTIVTTTDTPSYGWGYVEFLINYDYKTITRYNCSECPNGYNTKHSTVVRVTGYGQALGSEFKITDTQLIKFNNAVKRILNKSK